MESKIINLDHAANNFISASSLISTVSDPFSKLTRAYVTEIQHFISNKTLQVSNIGIHYVDALPNSFGSSSISACIRVSGIPGEQPS